MTSTVTALQEPIQLQEWKPSVPYPQAIDTPSPTEIQFATVEQRNEIIIQQLKPADGGKAAWSVLIAAFVFEALLWGFPVSFGVFQNYYSALPEFKDNPNIALIGTIAQGLSYLGAPLSAAFAKQYPKYRQYQLYLGWPICLAGLVAGSFTDSLGGLIATQGFMYGFGFVTLLYPILSMVDEWWVLRKGMAFGLISSASGATGVVMPFIINALLKRFGHKTTLRAIAVALAILTGPLLPTLKGRLPVSERSNTGGRVDWSFFRKPLFYIYGLSTLISGLALFFPSTYLPTYATAIGLSSTQGALALAVMSLTQLTGTFAFGWLSDKKVSISLICIVCSGVTAIAIATLWGLAKSLAPLLVFALLFGFFGYGSGVMRVGMGRTLSDDPPAVFAIYSILVFLQGIGNVLVGPISNALISGTASIDVYGISRFKGLVVFSTACMGGSAVVIAFWHGLPKSVKAVTFGFGCAS